jgi:hypothetical protein
MNRIPQSAEQTNGASDRTSISPANPAQADGHAFAMTTICMICHRQVLSDGQPGLLLPVGRGYSHGCCRQCVPELCQLSGLDATATAEIVAFADASYSLAE